MWSAQPVPPSNPGSVEEDAGVVDEPGDRRRGPGGILGDPASPGLRNPFSVACAWNCMWRGLEPYERSHDGLHVLVVDEVGAVAAAPLRHLLGRCIEHALTAVAVDAPVVRTQVCRVEDPGALLVRVLERDPLMHLICGRHGGAG